MRHTKFKIWEKQLVDVFTSKKHSYPETVVKFDSKILDIIFRLMAVTPVVNL